MDWIKCKDVAAKCVGTYEASGPDSYRSYMTA